MDTDDRLLAELWCTPRPPAEHALALRHSPTILFDAREPFQPLAAGYSIFRADAVSPSCPHTVRLAGPAGQPPAVTAIEYAIWWDWDIQHLYELEHIWVYLDAHEHVTRLDASWHGRYRDVTGAGPVLQRAGRPYLYSEAGKHAFAADPEELRQRYRSMRRPETSRRAGNNGIVVNQYFAGQIWRTPYWDTLVRSHLRRYAFQPTFDFSLAFDFAPEMLLPWSSLRAWIPRRVHAWLDRLARDIPPVEYVPLRIVAGCRTPQDVAGAAERGADMVEVDVAGADGADVVATATACQAENLGLLLSAPGAAALQRLSDMLPRMGKISPIVAGPAGEWPAALTGLPTRALLTDHLDGPAIGQAVALGAAYIVVDAPASDEAVADLHARGLGVIARSATVGADGLVIKL